MKRRLIVTADDFGDTPQVNAAVVRAHREGVLRFASLMVLRPAAEEAAALAKANPRLGVGLHLELCERSPAMAGLRYVLDPKARAGLEGEIRTQIERLLALGIEPTHVDGHINIHVHPVVFPAVCRLAKEYGIPRVRLPAGEWPAYRALEGLRMGTAALAGVFGVMGAWVRGGAAGLEVPRTWGLLRSGLMTEEYVLGLLARLPGGTTELYFHPTSDPAQVADGRPTPSHQNAGELAVLLSPRVRAALIEHKIDLVAAR